MEKRKCLNCNNPIPENKRADSKFCSNSCKAWYWEKQKENKGGNKPKEEIKQEKKIEKGTPLNGLRGVIDNIPKAEIKPPVLPSVNYPSKAVSDCLPTDTKEENPEYKRLAEKVTKFEGEIKKDDETLQSIERKLQHLKTVNNPYANSLLTVPYFKPASDMYLLKDFFESEMNNEDSWKEKEFEKHRKDRIEEQENLKRQCIETLSKNKNFLKIWSESLGKTAQFIEKPKSLFKSFNANMKENETNKNLAQSSSNPTETKENENNLNEIKEESNKIPTNGRLISSEEFMRMDYKSLDFQGRWKDFLGQPAVTFHYAVHGLPAGGKSTFCAKLAKYLAENFGYVVYLSGEEGFSKTLKDRLLRNKAFNPNLYLLDAKNVDDIKEQVPTNTFHFIFIDSLDTLRINAVTLKGLKEYYSPAAFITISQSTKEGKMKGDNEILHDADTIIRLSEGTATLSKNRFNPIADKEFEVFHSINENPKKKEAVELRNVI